VHFEKLHLLKERKKMRFDWWFTCIWKYMY